MALKPLSKIKSGLEKVEAMVQLSRHKVKSFRPKISFQVEGGPYVLRTAENVEDLISCLRLRYTIFHQELLSRKDSSSAVDVDEMDVRCDHLMIIDRVSSQIVGTYRVASSLFTDKFYSQGEFHLESLLSQEGAKVELGRACIHRDHRTGMVVQMLWRGIGEYFKATRSQYLFGCTSIKTTEPMDGVLLARYVQEKGWTTDRFPITPTKDFRILDFLGLLAKDDRDLDSPECVERVKELLPTLMLSYIRAGAKVVLEPALDRDFACIDFLTIMDLEEVSSKHKKKFIEGF